MDRRKRNITAIGGLVLAGASVFIWGFYYLLGTPIFGGGTGIYVEMHDGAGVKRGDPVELQGVRVGSVGAVQLRAGAGVLLALRLEYPDLKVPADTRAAVRGDVFGAHSVQLLPGSALVRLEEGDTIRGAREAQLPDLAAELGGRARAVLAGADSLLSPAAIRDVHETAAALPAGAQELRAAFVELHAAAAALHRTSEGVEKAGTADAMTSALGQVEESARALTTAANTMNRSLDSFASIMQKVDSGQGTLGRLVNDSTLYRDLHETVREVGALATDMRVRPGRYVTIKVF